eukprot:jgi/Undpi1/11759/HiC_scaffold_37.g14054.m1
MTTHRIKQGFDIRLEGRPDSALVDADEPNLIAVCPTDFPGIKPKLTVKKGDEVAIGQPLFLDKNDRDVVFCSPAAGKVHDVVLGARRFPLQVIVERGADKFHDGPKLDAANLAGVDREAAIAALKGAGLWPLLRQRPIGRLIRGDVVPSAIFINGMDTEPLAADPAFAVQGQRDDLQLAVNLLSRLTDGPVVLTVRDGASCPEFDGLNVETHRFAGPHPAGLVGTHIHHVRPLRDTETAWYLKAQEAALIGAWLRTGHYPSHRVVAVGGSRAPEKKYFRVRQGAPLPTLTGGQALPDSVRVINGTALSGDAVASDGYLGFYATTVTAMPDGDGVRDLFGWALPQMGKLSTSRSVWGWLTPRKTYDLDARMHGGPRANVNIGQMENVMALDVLPTFLIRAIQAGDLEEALGLGLLEVTEEDVALCTFADASKLDVGAVVREGLDLYEKEG